MASSTPPTGACPALVAAAGTATSTNPMATPKPMAAKATVRMPGLASAPSRSRALGSRSSRDCARTAGASAKQIAPMIMQTLPATTPVPGGGEGTRLALHVEQQRQAEHGDRQPGEQRADHRRQRAGRAEHRAVVGEAGGVGHVSQYACFWYVRTT